MSKHRVKETKRKCMTCVWYEEYTGSCEGVGHYPMPAWLLNFLFKLRIVSRGDGYTCACWKDKK